MLPAVLLKNKYNSSFFLLLKSTRFVVSKAPDHIISISYLRVWRKTAREYEKHMNQVM